MVFDKVFPTGSLIEDLGKEYNRRFAVVPFMDCMPNTSYLVSDDGHYVFVSVDFGGYCQTKNIPIIPAGKRSKHSMPAFKRRTARNTQIYNSLAAAVYGAFILGEELPRFKLFNIDGNPNNCSVENLTIADDSSLASNMRLLSGLYKTGYNDCCRSLTRFSGITQDEAQDLVSDAFIRMCCSTIDIDLDKAAGLWLFLAKQDLMTFKSRNRILYDLYDILQNFTYENAVDEEFDYSLLTAKLPKECRRVIQLILSGYNQYEIAQAIGCSQAWVSKLLSKTKKIITQYDK